MRKCHTVGWYTGQVWEKSCTSRPAEDAHKTFRTFQILDEALQILNVIDKTYKYFFIACLPCAIWLKIGKIFSTEEVRNVKDTVKPILVPGLWYYPPSNCTHTF